MTTPPRFIEPQLSTLVKAPPAGEEWVHEIKYDGYRMAIHFAGPKVQLLTRTGLDWTDRYPDVAKAAAKLRLKDAYIDGELCEVRKDGTTGFPEEGSENIAFFAFDLLFHDGKDMMRLPLADRKAQLEKRLKKAGSLIRYAEHIDGEGNRVLQAACTMKVEGVISKRRNAPYVPGDRATWQKSKCYNQEEFIIVGFTRSEGSRPHISSLLLGYYDENRKLTYAGRGGGGMSGKQLAHVHEKLGRLITPKIPLAEAPPKTSRFGTPLDLDKVIWIKPKHVCEVRFLNWTDGGMLRQVTFLGLRQDKPAGEIRRRRPQGTDHASVPPARTLKAHRFTRANVMRALPDAVVPSKEQLKEYWSAVGGEALQYLGKRPLTLVRNVGDVTFFHKGALPPLAPAVHQMHFTKAEGTEGVRVWVDDMAGLLGLVDMDVIEVHPWQATVDDIEHADLVVFDLDPGDGIAWSFVTQTALDIREVLSAAGLKPWVKTSGGKGLHIMVPLEQRMAWREVRKWTKAAMVEFARRDRRYTTSSTVDRTGRLFLDYLRNGRGNTAVGTYSPRVRARFPVSVPVSWSQVARISPDSVTMEDLMLKRAKNRGRILQTRSRGVKA